MSRRLRVPSVLAVVILGSSAIGGALIACGSEDPPPTTDAGICTTGPYCVQDPSPGAATCPTIGACAEDDGCPIGCLIA